MNSMARYLLKWDFLMLTSISGSPRRSRKVRVMRWISRSADGQAYPAILVTFAILQSNRGRVLTACLFAFAIDLAAYALIKRSVRRPRPFQALAGLENLVVPPDTFSFPSGHTAGAFLVAILISFYHPFWLIPLCSWAALVGISRIFLCVHYPTDVLAGACLGILSARFGLLLADQLALIGAR
jgi:undecaprenyl-diphosphatase